MHALYHGGQHSDSARDGGQHPTRRLSRVLALDGVCHGGQHSTRRLSRCVVRWRNGYVLRGGIRRVRGGIRRDDGVHILWLHGDVHRLP